LLFRIPRARLIALVFGMDSNLFKAIKGRHKPTLTLYFGEEGFWIYNHPVKQCSGIDLLDMRK
jgi:hypothetical protein